MARTRGRSLSSREEAITGTGLFSTREGNEMEAVDILGFDAVAQSEQAYEIELKDVQGEGTGVYVSILGKHADAIIKWTSKIINQMERERAMAQKAGKQPPIKTIEELREQNVEGAALRVTGWRNVKQQFSQDLMKQALRRNPHWVDQIINESDDLGNFTKKP